MSDSGDTSQFPWLSEVLGGHSNGSGPPPQAFYAVLEEIVRALNALTTVVSGLSIGGGGGGGSASVSFQQPASGATLTGILNLGCFECDPATPIAVLNVVLPPTPLDTATFEITTTKTITTLTVTAPGGATVDGGVLTLAGNSGISFRYRQGDTTWRRRW